MRKNAYKEVGFEDKLKDQVDFQDFEPIPEEVSLLDRLGYKNEQLYKNNVRELAIAKAGVQEFYVATSSGGAVTTKLTFTDGILTEVT